MYVYKTSCTQFLMQTYNNNKQEYAKNMLAIIYDVVTVYKKTIEQSFMFFKLQNVK